MHAHVCMYVIGGGVYQEECDESAGGYQCHRPVVLKSARIVMKVELLTIGV
jgi:hypothetical protein